MLRKFQNHLNIVCVMTSLWVTPPAKADLEDECQQARCTVVEIEIIKIARHTSLTGVKAQYTPCKDYDETNNGTWFGTETGYFCAASSSDVIVLKQNDTSDNYTFKAEGPKKQITCGLDGDHVDCRN